MQRNKIACWVSNRWTGHLETDIEIIARHVRAGDDVTVYVCGGDLLTCYSNLEGCADICNRCISRRRNGFKLAGITDKVKIRDFRNLTFADELKLQEYKSIQIESLEQLNAVELGNCEIGRAVFNELVGIKKNNTPDISVEKDYFARAIEMAALVYLSFKNNFEQSRPDIFYCFNQRFAITRPAVDAAIAAGIDYSIHERAGVMNRYWVTLNSGIHSLNYWKEQLQVTWNQSELPEQQKIALAEKWYSDRAAGMDQGWYSFVADQRHVLPEQFDPEKRNVVIFNSSEWELLGLLDDYTLDFYESQHDAVVRLAQDLTAHPEIDIYLRVHPHLSGKNNLQTKQIREELIGRFPNLHVISAESEISTYLLLARCDAVITFGSTVGVEAAFHRKPSILLGSSRYEDLEVCFRPKSHQELIDMLVNKGYVLSTEELEARRFRSLKLAFMYQAGGVPYELFEQKGVMEIAIKLPNGESMIIGDQKPPFEQGLAAELNSRAEMTGNRNPLAPTVNELVDMVVSLQARVEELEKEKTAQHHLLSEMSNSRAWKIARHLQELKSKITR